MATIDKRAATSIHARGSDIGLAVKLTVTEAVLVYGAESLGGWYVFAYTEGRNVAAERNTQEVRDEGGTVRKRAQLQDDFIINNTLIQTNDETFALLDLLAETPHVYRYALPAGRDASGDPLHQLFGLRNAYADGDFTMPVSHSDVRKREFTIRASAPAPGVRSYEVATVKMTAEAEWPAKMDDFKTTPPP